MYCEESMPGHFQNYRFDFSFTTVSDLQALIEIYKAFLIYLSTIYY